MSPLAETQAAIRGAIIDKNAAAVLPRLVGGRDPTYRLSIHQRHYEASLITALARRFPALEWLVGSAFMVSAATDFVRRFPPVKPCLAEYGEDFPRFLAERRGAEAMPWLRSVGDVEWHLGTVSVAIDHPAIGLDRLAQFDNVALDDLRLRLQPGLAYSGAAWPVDELVKLHLNGSAPDQLAFDPAEVWLEIRGARGAFAINRLDKGAHAFRGALARNRPIAAAIAEASDADPGFEPGTGLAQLFADSLVTAITALDQEPEHDRN